MKNCKLLVPIDFSEGNQYALQAAEKLALLFDGTITPFHSYVPASETYDYDIFGIESAAAPMIPDIEEMEELHRGQLQEYCEEIISKELLNDPVIAIGNPVSTIIEAADEAAFIVLGSHGRSGFSRFFMGSVSDKILRTAHKPVLIVGKEKQLKSFDKIMLTTDFSEHSKEPFPLAVEIAQKAQAHVTLFHVLSFDMNGEEPDEAAVSKREQRLDVLAKQELAAIEGQLETRVMVSSNNAHEAILNESLNNEYDLIIMAAVGHTGIEYLMMGSTTSNVVRHVQTPALSVNPKTKRPNDEEK
jgi:nucleotide-binding universal stress UspA family protein